MKSTPAGVFRSRWGHTVGGAGVCDGYRWLVRVFMPGLLMASMASASTRVALVDGSPAPSAASMALADLSIAELGKVPGIDLLERSAIESVLAEQQLTGSQVKDVERMVRVGALLETDIFVVLATLEGLKGSGLIAFKARSGERLVDVAIDAGTLDEQAAAVRDAIQDAVHKYSAPEADRRTVCLAAVRNADMPRSMDVVCESMGMLLERNLLRSATVSVLERRQLESVLAERVLTGTPEGSLRASVVLINLDLSRSGEVLTATALLKDAAGADLGTAKASAPVNDSAGLVAVLTTAILERLGAVTPVAPADATMEAAYFAAEGKVLLNHSHLIEATRAMEAACALDPQPAYRAQLGMNYAKLAELTGKSNALRAVAYAHRALDLSDGLAQSPEQSRVLRELMRYAAQIVCHQKAGVGNAEQESVRLRYLDEIMARERDNNERAAGRLPPLARNGEFDPTILTPIRCSCVTGTEYAQHVRTLMTYWLAEVDRSGIKQTWWWDNHRDSFLVHNEFEKDEGYVRIMQDVADLFRQHRERTIRIFGAYIGLWIDARKGLDPAVVRERIEALDREGRRWIEEADGPMRKPNIYQTYHFLLAAYDVVGEDRAYRAAQYQDLFNFMTARKELLPYVGMAAVESSLGTVRYMGYNRGPIKDLDPSVLTNLVHNCDRILAAFSDPTFTLFSGGGELWQTFCVSGITTRRNELARRCGMASSSPFTVRQIFSLPETNVAFSAQTLVGNDLYYAVMYPKDGGGITIGRLHLPEARPENLAHLKVEWADKQQKVSDLVVDRGQILVGTSGAGLFILDPQIQEPVHIGQADGLPSDHIQALVRVDGVVYAGIGAVTQAAYIVAYDLTNRTCEVVASSQRLEKKSPLDNLGLPFSVSAMRPDPERNRILLVVDCGEDRNSFNDFRPEIGIWELRVPSRELRQLVRFNRAVRWVSHMREGTILLAPWSKNCWQPSTKFRPWYGAVSFDLATDRARIVYANIHASAGPDLPITSDTILSKHLMTPPYYDTSAGFWGELPKLSWLSRDGSAIEPMPDEGSNGNRVPLPSFELLEKLEDGRFVGVGNSSVWLVGESVGP